MHSFSSKQRLHCFAPLWYAVARFNIDNFKEKLRRPFFRSQLYLNSSVSFECFLSRKDFVWFLYRTLNSLDVIPIYFFVSALSVVVTSALFITLVAKQFSGIGHSSFLRQLHLFCVGTLLGFVFERMWVLCVLMAAFMFGMQL